MSKDRQMKLGRRAELQELRHSKRIEIDLLARATRDLFEPRDVEMVYTEKINTTNLMVYVKEIGKKSKELAAIVRELVMIEDELGVTE